MKKISYSHEVWEFCKDDTPNQIGGGAVIEELCHRGEKRDAELLGITLSNVKRWCP